MHQDFPENPIHTYIHVQVCIHVIPNLCIQEHTLNVKLINYKQKVKIKIKALLWDVSYPVILSPKISAVSKTYVLNGTSLASRLSWEASDAILGRVRYQDIIPPWGVPQLDPGAARSSQP